MDPRIIAELLRKIHFYYPVGMPQIYNDYDGYKLMVDVVAKKIDGISYGLNSSWKNLVLSLEKDFSSYKVFDFSYFQFPSYYLKIGLESTINNGVKLERSLIIIVSLLVDYFTVYMDDYYDYSNNYSGTNSDLLIQRVVYNRYANKRIYLESIEFVKSIVYKYFANHKFLSHKQLFQIKIVGSGTYGDMQDVDSPHSLYEYLFNNDLIKDPEILD